MSTFTYTPSGALFFNGVSGSDSSELHPRPIEVGLTDSVYKLTDISSNHYGFPENALHRLKISLSNKPRIEGGI